MKSLLFCAGAMLVFPVSQAAAQTGTEEEMSSRIADIIVTATRTGATNVQSTPIAITAFGAEQLRNSNITAPTDLQFHEPNLSLVAESQGSITFGVPGINVAVDNFSFDNALGIYVNDVYIA
jgi:iron complex outermembrane receptor protein